MQVHRGTHHWLGTNHVADGADEISLNVVVARHAHGSVNVEEDPVHMTGLRQAVADFGAPLLVGQTFHGSSRQG